MARWSHAVCDMCWEAQEGVCPVRRAKPVIEFCGWCAQRTESGIYRQADPADVPFPDKAYHARGYIAGFCRFTLPGTTHFDTDRRRIRLDRMTDADAVFVAGEFRRIEIEAARRAASRRSPPARLLRLS